MIGYGFGIYAAWRWYQELRKRNIPEDTDGQLVFWGRGMICGITTLSTIVSPILLAMDLSGASPQKILLGKPFLFYAVMMLLAVFAPTVFHLVGVLNGIAGQVVLSEGENIKEGILRTRCTYVGESGATSAIKTCMYRCKGYGAIATFPWPSDQQCPDSFNINFPGP